MGLFGLGPAQKFAFSDFRLIYPDRILTNSDDIFVRISQLHVRISQFQGKKGPMSVDL